MAQRGEHAFEVGVFAVHAVDHNHPRQAYALGDLPGAVCAHLRPRDCIDDHEGHVRRLRPADHFGNEVRVAWRIDEVDLSIFPLHRDEREVEAELSLMFVLVVVAQGVLIFDCAEAADAAADEHGRFSERGLPDAAVTHEDDVADIFGCVDLHGHHPSAQRREP